MSAYLQSLIDYIQKEKITFREEGDQPCLDSIWWHYGECYNLDSSAAKEGFRNLGNDWMAYRQRMLTP